MARRAAIDIGSRQTLRESRDALLQRAAEEPDLSWRVLSTINAFRALIAAALLIIYFASGEPRVFGDEYPTLFWITSGAYFLFALAAVLALSKRWVAADIQAFGQTLVDIAAIVMLMHASGGIASGLGGLLIVFVGAASLVLPRQVPTMLAAVATFAILGQQAFAQFSNSSIEASYPAAGILSAVIFAMALATRPLGRRIQASEALARQRGVDLQNLSELNEYIVQHLRESIVVIDADDTIRLSNASATRLLGAPDQVRGLPLGSIFEPLAAYIREWRSDAEKSSHPEFTVITSGDSLRITAHLAPLGKDGVRGGPVLVFLEDASLMNARVQQSKLASLGRLSASIAHEIRNPVGAMSHAAQLLRESPGLNEDDQRLTEIIETHSGRVSHIIDNVLQLSRRDSSQPERLALKPWLEDFAQEFSNTLELQEGEIGVADIPDDLEVRMDRSHLRQVLWNLCDNAVKYASETGGIMVELHGDRLQGPGRPYVEVRDHGLGVDAATAEKMFEPFYTERSGGTGLGLYISRELCELNRATLLYLDRPGGGSIFRIVFADPDRWEDTEK
ncbi:MAG: PAS domain-containing protein [Woeseiaceae bacterium]|nr:PAS domain-containing protein [Woeseiaceae bacterium]NIP21190.1 PAS domain-containing protein [Woeseiaceae bacterium]NIS90162.1 PAS domain-containing protein [Woeseiaceae bacterium]